MQRVKYIVVCVIVSLSILSQVQSFEIILNNSTNDSYRIRLFQRHLMTIRLYPNEYQQNSIGFQMQVKGSDPRVLDVRREIARERNISNTNDENNILLEDFFICKYSSKRKS